jgi:8-oxo-dGTP diphosphatase
MSRITRYQGAVIHNDQILLIKQRYYKDGLDYWILPGGGLEDGETEEECIKREIKEETNLDVFVEKLLLDLPGKKDNFYPFYKTYLCKPLTDNAKPGYEPEVESGSVNEISEVGWYDLHSEVNWPSDWIFKRFFYPVLKKIQKILGYE